MAATAVSPARRCRGLGFGVLGFRLCGLVDVAGLGARTCWGLWGCNVLVGFFIVVRVSGCGVSLLLGAVVLGCVRLRRIET